MRTITARRSLKISAVVLIAVLTAWGIYSLTSERAGEPEVDVELGEIKCPSYYPFPMYAYLDVTVIGDVRPYRLVMIGPENTELGYKNISENDMKNGSESVNIYFKMKEGKILEGTYVLKVTDISGSVIFEEENIIYRKVKENRKSFKENS